MCPEQRESRCSLRAGSHTTHCHFGLVVFEYRVEGTSTMEGAVVISHSFLMSCVELVCYFANRPADTVTNGSALVCGSD